MVSHGGAGVLHSTLRAGIPAIIAPFFGDQFFHAKLIQARELGAATSNNQPVATLMGVGVCFITLWGKTCVFFSPTILRIHQFLVDFFGWMNLFLRISGSSGFSTNGFFRGGKKDGSEA